MAFAAIIAGVGQGLDKLGVLIGSSTAAVAGQAALANTITQGVAVATGLQKRFDFAGVAVAGIVAGTISAVSRNLPGAGVVATKTASAVRPTILNQTLSGTAALIAGAGARSIVTGTSFGDNITAALPDAIGATIGNAVAGRLARGETALMGADDKRPGTNQGDFAPGQKGIQLASSDGSIGDVTFADIKAAGQRAYDAAANRLDDLRAFVTARAGGASFDAAVEAATDVKNTITVTATRLSDSIASAARPYLDSLTNLTNAITGGLNRAGEVQFRADRAEAAGNRAFTQAAGRAGATVFNTTLGPGTLYDRTIAQPFYTGLRAVANSPLGDPGVGIAIDQASNGAPPPLRAVGFVAGRTQNIGARGVQALSALRFGRAGPVVGEAATLISPAARAEALVAVAQAERLNPSVPFGGITQNRGLAFVTENLGPARNARIQFSRDFASGTAGAASDTLSRSSIVPALRFDNKITNGNNLVRFDGFEVAAGGDIVLIDAKTRLFSFESKGKLITPDSVKDQLRRQSAALKQNPGFRGVIEVPNSAAQIEASDILIDQNITNIIARVRGR